MAATPLTLMDGGLASAAVTADANATLDSADAVTKTAPSSAIRPTMLFSSTERLDTSANMLASPHGSSGGNSAATSPSFLPEMPQWKKDLIQRRKSNVARTIGAAVSPTSAASAAAMQQQRYSLTGGQLQSPTTAADGFSPTTTTAISVTPTRDLSAVTSKSATQVATTTTKVSKLTASQQQQQHQLEQEQLYQYQQKHATVITAEQQQHQMSLIMKMPAATAAASSPTASGTIVSPIPRASKRNSPAGSNNSSPSKEKSERILLGGHYTTQPQPGKEYRESGDDRDSDWDTRRQMLSPTTTAAAPPISGITTIKPLHKTIAPIPKQRSAYSPVKNASAAAVKESVSGHTNQLASEQRVSTTTRLTGTTGTAALRAELQSTAGGDGGGGGSGSHFGVDDGTTTPYNVSAVAAGSGHGDGEECMADEKQENETIHRATAAESGGEMYATTGRQIPSTTSGSPTRASVSVASPLSPKLVAAQAAQSQQSQQFHSKNERERTYTEQRGTSTSSSAGSNSNTNTTTKVQTQENTTIINNRHYNASTSSYSPSNYAIPQQNNSGVSGSGKIFSKLHNNQFIKNQQQQHQQLQQTGAQPSTATQSNITARYLKYKSQAAHAQESGSGSETGSTSTNYSGSPTKSFVAPTASAIKKKMVAVQEMKKTTQPSSNHGQLHTHRTHHNHQQMISAGGGGTCARTALSGGRAQPPSQTDEVNFDPAEDLSYGPGIVSKLRCRYLSLAFRESMEKERHCLDNMRRATSLNNLLDRDDAHDEDEPEDDLDSGGAVDVEVHDDEEYVELRADADRTPNTERKLKTQGILKHSGDAATQDNTKKTTTFQKNANAFAANGTRLLNSAPVGSAGDAVSSANVAAPDTPRSRHVKRGNDSLKRARSVEALLCERSPWQYAALNRTSYQPQRFTSGGGSSYAATQPTCVTIEDKINNARSRLILGTDIMPPKRLTSVIDDTERPPPDLVKQTLKKFEATANRRGRGPNRTNGTGEVASKVATYKTIIKENKPAIVFPKPPLSPTKKINSPLLSKPLAKPVVGANDLLNSPLGRKTTAAAAANASAAVTGNTQAATSNVAAAGGLSENSPDIIPRHKLLTEKSESLLHGVVDSPVTALTKKLEKLRINAADKQQQQLQTITTKETKQPAQLNKQSQHSALEVTSSDNEFVNSSELNNDNNASNSSQLVGGAHEGEAAGDSDAALEGNENSNNNKTAAPTKQHNDRAGTGTGTGISASGESAVEPDTAQAGTAAISSDLSDDDDGLIGIAAAAPTKRITRTALDNIARAGTTQQFKFAGSSGQTNVGSKSTVEPPKTKPQTNLNPDIPTSVLNAAPGKQIGVIRPLLTTTAAQQAANANTTNSGFSHQQQLLQQHLEALKQNNVYNNTSSTPTSASNATATHSSIYHSTPPLTSREIEKNRINEMKKTVALADGSPITATMVNASNNATSPAAQHAANASLNTVINTNAPGHKSNNAGATSSTAPIVGGSSGTSGFNELDAAAPGANNSPLWALRIKRQTPPSVPQENTSMVFNFSNRKEVPDYIENDGVIFRRKRELPKPNESGFVLLGDLSLETSTDSDYDDFSMCPPSPCDVEFENANIVIDGKSSIRQKSKEATFRVQFNDTLTSTFEYPSEASLIIDDSYSNDALIGAYENLSLNDTTDSSPARHHHVAVDEIIQLPTPANTSSPANNASSATNTPTKNILGNLPLDYPILDKGIMSQQQQEQQQQQPPQQQLEQSLTLKEAQNAVSVAAPAALLSAEPLQSNSAEKTLLLQPQREIACNASQQPTPSPPRAENSDKHAEPVQTCAAAARLPPQPPTLPQRPTDLPLPMLLTTLPQQKSKLAQSQQRPVAQQKPPLPVKRLEGCVIMRQPTHAAPTATKVVASPASALPQFKLEAEMKQQKDIKTLTEAIKKNEAQQTTVAGSSKREMRKQHTSGNWQHQPTVAGEQEREKAQQKVEQAKAIETNKLAVGAGESPIAFDMRGVAQPSLLRDFQLASANACEINCKNVTSTALKRNNTAANGGMTRHNTNNLAFANKPNITPTTTKKPISKYTMFHTLFETSPTEEAAANTTAQRPRKTPAVLNKPQYARFLQIERAAATAPAAGQAILRTRSNEFRCGGGVNPKQRGGSPASNQLVAPSATQQQRSASFSFGNNAGGERAECATANVCPSPTPANVVITNSKPSAATAVNKCKKEMLKSIGNSLNGTSTDDECFEDAIDYFYPIPTITLAEASCYENTNSVQANSMQHTESQNNTTTTATITTTTNNQDSASAVALPSTLHTRTVCTNTKNKNNTTITTTTIAPTTITPTITTLISNTCTQTTLNEQPTISNQTTNTSLTSTSSHTATSSTTFYSYSSFSAANCTRHNSFAAANINYKTTGNAQHSTAKYLRPTPFKANQNLCNNNASANASKTRVNYNSANANMPPSPTASGALSSPFSLPVASTTLLRSRIPGNTLYYV